MDRWTGGRGFTKYRFTLQDIARIKGVTIHAVRKAVSRGILNPEDLESICRYIQKKRKAKQ